MAELATIARPYAEALFKASASDLNGAVAWVTELAAVAENSDLQQFAENPKATNTEVFSVVTGVVKAALDDHAKNFLRLVIENGRLNRCLKLLCNSSDWSMRAAAHLMQRFSARFQWMPQP